MKQIDERLRDHYAELTPQEQRVADFIFASIDDLMSYNSAELARLSGVSKATVSRLFKRLGYPSYRDMRDEMRTLRQSGMPLTDSRDAVQGNTLLSRHYKQEMANLTQWINQIDGTQFGALIAALNQARQVRLLGFRNSYPVALHLRQQLIQVRAGVMIMPQPGQTLAEELVDLTAQDVVIFVAFRRRPRMAKAILMQLQSLGVPVLLICEPQAQTLIPLATWHLAAPLDSVSAFDSYSSAMSLANLLSNALLHDMLASGRQRIHQISDLYNDLDELEQR
ncbi:MULTISPECIES: MurR/RpiR family transcriptional regulator [Rahnella]|jgi:DNA-binding MurR/RpiR family transcriptional regulator|uniref:MurR/RpiR family transcriptional regulator n=1 Tax=Rahnella sp. (strain Y9602) TaxID=2703885 RepID=A0ABW6CAY5_RAHSY|nr:MULTISPECIES: MurR/RpiR family transcriptional regulator [Rahnella]AYA05907.1 MurR/RpiR family transcriptional regulator [Rahnella aquatilis]AZP41145.1 MurR/RpiR family transcriptional regulator [Rahnella aquatilis]AZP45486.1 MurR/RpiR family transcriptional regulator [Rahnella aquatilis]AZP49855.1 MurR/RpiR family transcriptional regulator [Rahnella aquatilis]MBU9840204.1 MurR/RpiR family transcriptional regulator [Rahnella aceris]